ncbi:MAG: hypothetical protein HY960_10715 [Ignavibacteriae bacterium]|nr:hypothetical protein [Ignavibacteriota bacterium]
MKFSKGQFEAFYEITKEASVVVLGGLVVGGVLTDKVNYRIVFYGIIIYLVLVIGAIYFKKKGE